MLYEVRGVCVRPDVVRAQGHKCSLITMTYGVMLVDIDDDLPVVLGKIHYSWFTQGPFRSGIDNNILKDQGGHFSGVGVVLFDKGSGDLLRTATIRRCDPLAAIAYDMGLI